MSTQLRLALDSRDNSYRELVASGQELNQMLRLYDLYNIIGDLTDREAAAIMHIPEGRVAARRNKLIQERYPVVSKGIVKDRVTNRSVHRWGLQR